MTEEVPVTTEGMVRELRGDVLRLQRTMESLTEQFHTYTTTTSTMGTHASLPTNSRAKETENCVTSPSVNQQYEQHNLIQQHQFSCINQRNNQQQQLIQQHPLFLNDNNQAVHVGIRDREIPAGNQQLYDATREQSVMTGSAGVAVQKRMYMRHNINDPLQNVGNSFGIQSMPMTSLNASAGMFMHVQTRNHPTVSNMPSIVVPNNATTWGVNNEQQSFNYGNRYSVREVIDVLPTFDPNVDSITSVQFIERVEELKNAYNWNDGLVLFAIRSRLLGVAKLWVDAQRPFNNWQDFVIAFIDDFPCIVNSADIHMQMMNMHQRKSETVTDYYYTMLAIGRRGQLDDNAIARYIINGLEDYTLRKSLSAMLFAKCSDLLRSLQNVMMGTRVQTNRTHSKQFVQFERNSDHKENKDLIVKTPSKPGVTCYNYRQVGHISRNCPKPPRKPKDTLNAIINSNIVTKSIMLNDITCNALIDSGSAVSLVKRSIVEKLDSEVVECEKILQGFAGGEYRCKQKVKDIKMTIDDQRFNTEFYVDNNDTTTYEIIIGLDILSNGRVIIENGQCRVYALGTSDVQCNDNLQSDEKDKLIEVVNKYSDCFADTLDRIGKCSNMKMEISVTSSKPIARKPYVIPIPKKSGRGCRRRITQTKYYSSLNIKLCLTDCISPKI